MREDAHISDHDLLLAGDEELSPQRFAEVRSHLASCEACRARMHKLEAASVDLSLALRNASHLPDADDARAALLHRLAQQPEKDRSSRRLGDLVAAFSAPQWAYNLAFAVIAILGVLLLYRQVWLPNSGGTIAEVQAAPLPRPNLTPGATQSIPTDICLAAPREDLSAIPVSERKEVFREYGMDYRRAGQYELDHLITPALGGTDDIRNLWPEPYAATEWNAHVKDQLEDLLHKMVCSGQIDLATAQRDIATNWIDAYKRYFHTDKPLPSVGRQDNFPSKS